MGSQPACSPPAVLPSPSTPARSPQNGPHLSYTLRRAWEPLRRGECRVYKFRADGAGEELWGWVLEDFHSLQAFYRQAASLGEGVLVTQD
jgi:hypothetical protein